MLTVNAASVTTDVVVESAQCVETKVVVPTTLALDLGTFTGWALYFKGCRLSGIWNNKPGRYDGGGMRFLRFIKALDELQALHPIEMIYFEEVRRHAGTDAAHVYGGLMGVLTAWCEQKKVPYQGVPVGTIKKFWTGKGNADKAAMIAEACKRGYCTADDNEADAIALREMVLAGF